MSSRKSKKAETEPKHDSRIMPAVSVILPTLNRRVLLAKALKSIFEQTYKDFEVIVVDDGSTDGTAQFLRTLLDPRLRMEFTPHIGAAGTRNTAARIARGRLLAFCDSDDVWASNKLEKQAPLFDGDDPPLLVFSDARIMEWDTPTDETVFSKQRPYTGRIFRQLLLDNFIPTSSVVVSKKAFESTPGFETVFCPAEDYRLWLHLAQMGRCDFVEEPLIYYRRHLDQAGADLTVMFPACADVITNALTRAGMAVLNVPGLAQRLWQLHFVAAREMMRAKQPELARNQYKLAARYRRLSKADLFYMLSFVGV